MAAKPFLLLVNPRAGAGAAEAKRPLLESALREAGASFETAMTTGRGSATELARDALKRGLDGVAVVGGDGTLNETVNGFFDESGARIGDGAWIGILPAGTGGDFARTLGITSDVNGMATRLMWSKPRPIDVGWIEFHGHGGEVIRRAFINIASFGMSGLVDSIVDQGPKWLGGTPAYLFGAVLGLAKYNCQPVRITVDDTEARETKVLTFAVSNGRSFGGGMKIAPNAEIDDGWFELVGIENVSKLDALGLTPSIYTGKHIETRHVTCVRGKKLRAEPLDGDSVLLDIDGEAPGRLPATFELRPKSILLRG